MCHHSVGGNNRGEFERPTEYKRTRLASIVLASYWYADMLPGPRWMGYMGSCVAFWFALLTQPLHPVVWTWLVWLSLKCLLIAAGWKGEPAKGRSDQKGAGALHLEWDKEGTKGESADKGEHPTPPCGPRPSRAVCLWLYSVLIFWKGRGCLPNYGEHLGSAHIAAHDYELLFQGWVLSQKFAE